MAIASNKSSIDFAGTEEVNENSESVPVKVEPESDEDRGDVTYGSEYECDTDGQLMKLSQPRTRTSKVTTSRRRRRKRKRSRPRSRQPGGVGESAEPPTSYASASDLSELSSSGNSNKLSPTELTCQICGKQSKNQRLLKHHMKAVHTEEPAECGPCGKTFKNIELLKVHNRRNHSRKPSSHKSRLIKDRRCKQLARSSRSTSTSAISCIICNMDLVSKEALKSHETTEHNSPEALTCPQCKKAFTHIEALKHHVRRIHLEPVDETATCDICHLVLRNSKNLTIHLKNVHQNTSTTATTDSGSQPGKKMIGACPACHKEFPTTNTLNRHIRSHELEDNKTYQCKLCPANFRWEDGLSLHMLLAHEREEYIICGECGSGFSNRINFIRHAKTHIKEPVYECQLCGKLFRSPKYLRKHTRKVHGNESEKLTNQIKPNGVRAEKTHNENMTSSNHEFQDTWAPSPVLDEHLDFLDDLPDPADNLPTSRAAGKEPCVSKLTPSALASIDAESADAPDNDPDHWSSPESPMDQSPPSLIIDHNSNPSSPNSDSVTNLPTKPEVNAANENKIENLRVTRYSKSQANGRPRPEMSRIELENLKKCPKLKMRVSVDVKKYKALPCRKGYLFCDICISNFFTPKSLRLHMERLHGIIYVPKKTSKTIGDALKRLRAKNAAQSQPEAGSNPQPKQPINELPVQPSPDNPETETTESNSNGASSFPCDLCERSFDTKRKLLEHKKFIHGDTPQTCYICKTVLQNSQYLGRHMRWVHNHNPVVCELCGKEYGSSLKLGMHKRRVHRAQIYSCTICRTDHKTKGSLRLHIRNTHEDNGTRYHCEKCSSIFKRPDSLARHLEYAHGGQTFSCDRCGREFKSLMTLKTHEKNHIVEENFRCLYCSAKFNTNKRKAAHEDRHHWKKEGYECKLCKQLYDNCRALEKHILYRHTKEDLEKLYYEPAKNAAAPKLKQYKSYNHLMMEDVNPKTIQRGRKLKLTEEQKKERFKKYYRTPKSCSHCGTVCANRHEIYKHIAEVHPQLARIRCEPCNLGFVIPKFLYLHNAEVHNGPAPLACPEGCGESFFAADVLRYHMNTRHKGSQICEICGERSPTVATLRKHKETAHGHSADTTDTAVA